MSRKIITVIKALTGDRIIIGEHGLRKAFDHFKLSYDILLAMLERILNDPLNIFLERIDARLQYYLFYRQEDERYIVAVAKKVPTGMFLCTMYITGKRIKKKHLRLEKIL